MASAVDTSKFANYNFRPKSDRPKVSAKGPWELPPTMVEYVANMKKGQQEPWVGLTTDGTPVPGLYNLQKTGISLAPVTEAARAYLGSLNSEQRAAASFDVNSEQWRSWCNFHIFILRKGICLELMNDHQRELALGVLKATLSATGFQLARDIMRLNHTIGELAGNMEEFGEWTYWLSIFGEPSTDKPWGWQIDGHHLIINCMVIGDQLVMTPQFLGSEPIYAPSGKYKGVTVFQDEEAAGEGLMMALNPEQRQKAVIGETISRDVFVCPAFRDNMTMKLQGLQFKELSTAQQGMMDKLIHLYVDRIRPGHADIRMDEVKRHLQDTYFAWLGPVDGVSPFYYRVYSPVILIEFDHIPGTVLDVGVTRNHVHSMVRTPNGGDYGKDLLRQHYEQHDHADPHSAHRMGKE